MGVHPFTASDGQLSARPLGQARPWRATLPTSAGHDGGASLRGAAWRSAMRQSIAVIAASLALSAASAAHAGPYADELTKCLSSKMSDAERNALAVWLYEEMSANPT